MLFDLIKTFVPAILAFTIGIGITPILTHYLYLRQMWKKSAGKVGLDGRKTEIFNKLHETRETGTPRLGGIIIWFSAVATAVFLAVLARLFPETRIAELDFISRSQTWIPLFVLFLGALIGVADDLFEIKGRGGLRLSNRLMLVGVIGLVLGFWFYFKLDVISIGFPVLGPIIIGNWIIPLFAIVALAVYSGGIIDGIDGLAGGIFAIIFAAYGSIAFLQDQISLAAFCGAVIGGILAFLWFNIPPARFYMSETGSMSLTLTLSVVAFMTDALGDGEGLVLLPIIALPLFLTSLSVIAQMLSKKFLGRKLLLVAPLHHHFEAIGWPAYKVTMRYWVIGIIFAIFGLIFALIQ